LQRQRAYIVMACEDLNEAAQAGQQLSQLNRGCLITYRRAEDIILNAPSGPVALIVLAGATDPEAIRVTLRWMRHRWPRSPIAVVGDAGGGDMEMSAREGGASYLTRPVTAEQWSAMLSHVLGVSGRVKSEESLG